MAATAEEEQGARVLVAEGQPEAEPGSPASLITAIAVDVLIDGVLVGVGFAVGTQQGILLTIAITLELVLLGLSIASELSKTGTSRGKAIGLTCIPAGMLAAGAVLGVTVLAGLTGAALEIVLAFGIAALLYLVTEELLTEAHEGPETTWGATLFFAGFLARLVLDLLSAGWLLTLLGRNTCSLWGGSQEALTIFPGADGEMQK